MLENLIIRITKKCIWKTVALGNSIAVERFQQYQKCINQCDGYNEKCEFYLTQRKQYEE
jgi:hypothetical protein